LPTRLALLTLLSSGKISVTDPQMIELCFAITSLNVNHDHIKIALNELNQSYQIKQGK
jgi:hypothetical protein